jgi:signal transduction histidine kinase
MAVRTDEKPWGVMVAYARGLGRVDIPTVELFARQLAHSTDRLDRLERRRREIEDLKEAQDLLVRSERMAAVGQLAARIAHEIRNPLGAISNSIDSLSRRTELSGADRAQMDVVLRATDQLNELLTEFLDYSRPRELEKRPTDLLMSINDAVSMAQAERPGQAASVEVLGVKGVTAFVDPDLVTQAVLNLVLNAQQHTPADGRVQVSLEAEETEARIEVIDTGWGIPADILPRVFEPFFSTRSRGTGLGLAVVERTAHEHHGRVSATSEVGRGSHFVIRLPLKGDRV